MAKTKIVRSMKAWKAQAKRPDRIGDVSFRLLELAHDGTELAVRSLTRVEKATQPPVRTAKPAAPAAVAEAAHAAPRPGPAHAPARHAAKTPGSEVTAS